MPIEINLFEAFSDILSTCNTSNAHSNDERFSSPCFYTFFGISATLFLMVCGCLICYCCIPRNRQRHAALPLPMIPGAEPAESSISTPMNGIIESRKSVSSVDEGVLTTILMLTSPEFKPPLDDKRPKTQPFASEVSDKDENNEENEEGEADENNTIPLFFNPENISRDEAETDEERAETKVVKFHPLDAQLTRKRKVKPISFFSNDKDIMDDNKSTMPLVIAERDSSFRYVGLNLFKIRISDRSTSDIPLHFLANHNPPLKFANSNKISYSRSSPILKAISTAPSTNLTTNQETNVIPKSK